MLGKMLYDRRKLFTTVTLSRTTFVTLSIGEGHAKPKNIAWTNWGVVY